MALSGQLTSKKLAFYIILLVVSSFIKTSAVWGSHTMFFSLFCMLSPLSGAFFGFTGMLGSLIGVKFLLALFGKFPVVSTGLPTLAASLVWYFDKQAKTIFNRIAQFALLVLLPVSCITLFYFHPNVGAGWTYSHFWFVPIFAYFINYFVRSSTIMLAMQSTFVAHAVGSVIWLYMMPMNEAAWLALIPFVFVERLVFASGMALIYYGFYLCRKIPVVKESVSYATSRNDYGWQSPLGSK